MRVADYLPPHRPVGTARIRLAVALLCQPVPGEDLAYNQRMVAILTDGLRCVTDKDS